MQFNCLTMEMQFVLTILIWSTIQNAPKYNILLLVNILQVQSPFKNAKSLKRETHCML